MTAADDEQTKQLYAYVCYGLLGSDVIFLCLVLYMRSKIAIAIGIIREASKALGSMPALVLFPLLPCALAVLLILYWVVVAGTVRESSNVLYDMPGPLLYADAQTQQQLQQKGTSRRPGT